MDIDPPRMRAWVAASIEAAKADACGLVDEAPL